MKVIYVICAEEMRIIKQISFVQNCLHSHAKVVSIIAHLSIQQYPTNMLYIVCNIKTTERECKAELQGTHSFSFFFFFPFCCLCAVSPKCGSLYKNYIDYKIANGMVYFVATPVRSEYPFVSSG